MFRCDHHQQGAYCVSLLMLQCYNIWLKYIIVVNLAVWLHMLSGPCWCMSAALFGTAHSTLLDDGDHIETCCSYFNFNENFNTPLKTMGDRGSTVVKVLCYKSEGRWFDSRWCPWNFSLT